MEGQQLPEVSAAEAMRACRTCRFWQAHLPELVLGECRVNCPMPRERPGEPGASRLTAVDDWCASWHMVRAVRPEPPAA
jgi:hypothetical protein